MSGPRLHPAPPRGCPGSVPPATSLSPQCFCGSASVLRRGSGAGCRGARRRWGAPGGRHTGRGAGVHRLPSRGLTERALRVLAWFLALTVVLCPAAPEDLGGRLRGVEDTDPTWTLPHRCSGLALPFLLPPATSPVGWGSSYICSAFFPY